MFDEQNKSSLFVLIAFLVLLGGILLWAGADIRLIGQGSEFKASLFGAVVLLLALGLLAMAYFLSKPTQAGAVMSESPASPASDGIEAKTLRLIVVGAGILVFGTFAWAGGYVFWKADNSEIALPIVIIAGVIVLLLVLGLLTFVFTILKLSNREEALGLPSGSVRAVIALMLLVIFSIVAIFLYSDISSNSKLQTITLPADKVAEFKKNFDWVADADEVGKDGKATTNKIVHYRSGSKAAEDLAKQLIVLLGTLVTAVSSFYFGSSSIAAATKQPGSTGGPNAKSVKPTNLDPGGDPQNLTITGTNLANVVSVKLAFQKEEPILADASTIVAGDTSITCKITTSSKSKYGPWTLVVSDSANNDSRVPDGVTIGKKPLAPEPKTIDQPKLKADATHTLKISGANLEFVEKVRFAPDTGVTISNVKPAGSGEVSCTVAIAAQSSGEREVFVADKDNKEVRVPMNITIEA